jgi:hypothetical protein
MVFSGMQLASEKIMNARTIGGVIAITVLFARRLRSKGAPMIRLVLFTFVFALCGAHLRADNKSLKSEVQNDLAGKVLVSKIPIGGKGHPAGYSVDHPVNTLVYPGGKGVVYRVEFGLIRGEVQYPQQQFERGASFRVTATALKDDHLELKLESQSGEPATVKLMLGSGWQAKLDPANVRSELSQIFVLNEPPQTTSSVTNRPVTSAPLNENPKASPQSGSGNGAIGIKFPQANPQSNTESTLVISTVIEAGPADKAGLKPGDIIISVDGKEIVSDSEFISTIRTKEIGSKVKVDFMRGATRLEALVTVAAWAKVQKLPPTATIVDPQRHKELKQQLIRSLVLVEEGKPLDRIYIQSQMDRELSDEEKSEVEQAAKEEVKSDVAAKEKQDTAAAAALGFNGCCQTTVQAANYCKHWAAGWNKDSPAWEGWTERWFRISVNVDSSSTRQDDFTNYCPKVLIDHYEFEQSLKVPNWCFGQPESKYKSLDEQTRWVRNDECDPIKHTVTSEQKALAEMATAKDKEFFPKRCQDNDPRPLALKNSDPLCIQQAQAAVEAKRLEKERKKAEVAETKKEAQLKVTLAARRQDFKALGLHRLQSQALVKSILTAQGFAPWQCSTERTILVASGFVTNCLASRRRGSPDQDNVILIFNNVIRNHRDTDSGIVRTDGVERVLLIAKYARENDDEESVFGDDNKPF